MDPSPIKQGQKVRVIWGKGKKDYGATITCYPLIEEDESPAKAPSEKTKNPTQARTKHKLVSTFRHVTLVNVTMYVQRITFSIFYFFHIMKILL